MTAHPPPERSLDLLRREIERVDRTIVLLLAARLDAAQRALRLRAGRHGRTTDAGQERRVMLRSRAWARELGVPERLVESLFRALVEEGKSRFRRGETVRTRSRFATALRSASALFVPELGDLARPELPVVAGSR